MRPDLGIRQRWASLWNAMRDPKREHDAMRIWNDVGTDLQAIATGAGNSASGGANGLRKALVASGEAVTPGNSISVADNVASLADGTNSAKQCDGICVSGTGKAGEIWWTAQNGVEITARVKRTSTVTTFGKLYQSATAGVLTNNPDETNLTYTQHVGHFVKWVNPPDGSTPDLAVIVLNVVSVTALVAGSNVTLTQSGNDITIASSGGGGGGAGNIYGAYDIEDATYTDLGLSEEFEDGTLNSAWTVETGTAGTVDPLATVTGAKYDLTTRSKGMLVQTDNTSTSLRLRAATIADGEQLLVSFSAPFPPASSNNAYVPRLGLSGTTTAFSSPRSEMYFDGTNTNSISSFTTSESVGLTIGALPSLRFYFRLVRDGDTYHYFHSNDGTSWSPIRATTASTAAYVWIMLGSGSAWTRTATGDPIGCINWIRHCAYTGLDPW